MQKKMTTGRMLLSVLLAVLVLVIAQVFASIFASLSLITGIPETAANILAAFLYVLFAFIGLKFLADHYMGLSLQEIRICPIRFTRLWIAVSIFMPMIVCSLLLLTSGSWSVNMMDKQTKAAIITAALFFIGLATGIVEESVFRGMIMAVIEARWNRKVAIVIPSVLFALLHLMDGKIGLLSAIQLIIAGSIVGILFSLVTYDTGSIWCSALIHAVWNMVMIGGILHIGSEVDEYAIVNFQLKNRSFILSGGEFGIEASIVSIAVYGLFSVLAWYRCRLKKIL